MVFSTNNLQICIKKLVSNSKFSPAHFTSNGKLVRFVRWVGLWPFKQNCSRFANTSRTKKLL